VIIDGKLYFVSDGLVQCVEAASNKELWRQKFDREVFWASLVAAGDKIYATMQSGNTVVFAADATGFKQIAKNSLGEKTNSTPAISNGQIFLKTAGHLWCVEEK